jgi:hypothetical protein
MEIKQYKNVPFNLLSKLAKLLDANYWGEAERLAKENKFDSARDMLIYGHSFYTYIARDKYKTIEISFLTIYDFKTNTVRVRESYGQSSGRNYKRKLHQDSNGYFVKFDKEIFRLNNIPELVI